MPTPVERPDVIFPVVIDLIEARLNKLSATWTDLTPRKRQSLKYLQIMRLFFGSLHSNYLSPQNALDPLRK